MKDKYLFDTSALYPFIMELLKGKISFDFLSNIYILDLTVYEIGNVLWKDSKISNKIKDPVETMENFLNIIKKFNLISKIDYVKVLKIAIERDLTFYDSAYVYVAEENNLTLITYDEELLGKTKNAKKLDEIIG
ncbi:Exonuclease VapC9 [Metallosphaera sp. J1]|uniref:type II toxin-antitoxin system VapC family toxin n=1 Tax=Metallosphaera TaxID=41980 RepID=UPI001EDF9584|nr:type II toxin-antitoxin system VapC family toxin [Metallosphaera javensis (ex Hofmann et al. 2022)]MCG3109580.1 Exonuclease VapC9 [Metallosphaera javensis (ex Hofmann et al. 2022)]BCS93086.1 MAG: PIN domain nuclease [Metallosphaera javensis (ex Sakai et al. 2022)]